LKLGNLSIVTTSGFVSVAARVPCALEQEIFLRLQPTKTTV